MEKPQTTVTGRFAPSPTGRMHLGNLATALMSWLEARSRGGRWIVRIEDLDRERSRPQYARQLLDDLRWLGLEWDALTPPQSSRVAVYAGALETLRLKGLTYPCRCTRARLRVAGAPHATDAPAVYDGHCRPPGMPRVTPPPDTPANIRLYVPPGTVCTFDDMYRGPVTADTARECGDPVIRRADGMWAYQLAVSVDDALQGVTQVVRGDDLLLSTPWQIYIMQQLGLQPPQYGHIPLVRNARGVRLSKRDSPLSLEALRVSHTPAQVLGMTARALGLQPHSLPVALHTLLSDFQKKH